MNITVTTAGFTAPPVRRSEILRYSGAFKTDEQTEKLLDSCLGEAEKILTYKVCSCILPLSTDGSVCDFTAFKLNSAKLAKNLDGCSSALIFAATVGAPLDRLIAKYGRISPAKALIMQGLGAERIEALCDAFCSCFEKENSVRLTPRFSPGYGDLSLEAQRDIFSLLDCPRKIGLCLNESLLMSPSKSVTAIAGIKCGETEAVQNQNKCFSCGKRDCEFRRNL